MSRTKQIQPLPCLACPDREGVWLLDGEEIDVYRLEPTGGQLCIWGPDVGISYSGATETQFPWTSDEWQGHIPVWMYDDEGPWTFLRPLDSTKPL